LKLYTYDPAPNPRRLQLFLDYKGISLNTQQINLMEKEQFSDDFLKLNPSSTVPALELDDGTVLTEVIGMCCYLEELHPASPLMGSSATERALVISWDHIIFNTVFMAIAEAFRNSNPAFSGRALPGPLDVEQIPALAERGKLRLAAAWTSLDQHLGANSWLSGDNFTFADIDLMCAVEFAGWIKSSIPEDCKHLQAWHQRALDAMAKKS
jgi:glutathione S-transferase